MSIDAIVINILIRYTFYIYRKIDVHSLTILTIKKLSLKNCCYFKELHHHVYHTYFFFVFEHHNVKFE